MTPPPLLRLDCFSTHGGGGGGGGGARGGGGGIPERAEIGGGRRGDWKVGT